MGLFSDREDIVIVTCPICLTHFHAPQKLAHWTTHVKKIPANAAENPGQFTWTCACGPSNMTWSDVGGAAAGMGLHMQLRHNIPIE
jgi:hypothetical protein